MSLVLFLNKFFFKGSIIISLIFLTDPYDVSWGIDHNQILKYLGLIFAFFSTFFSLIINFKRKIIKFNFLFFCIFILFALMFFGSLRTFIQTDLQLMETFLGRSVSFFFFFSAYFYYSIFDNDQNHLRFNIKALSLFVIYAFLLLILKYTSNFLSGVYIFHEEILIITAPSILFFTYYKSFLMRNLLTFLSIFSGILSAKLTGFLSSIFSILLIIYHTWNYSNRHLLIKRIFMIFSFTCFISIILYILLYQFHLLPSGSPEVRNKVYLTRILMFYENPLFGTFFVGNPMIEVAWLYIPSHSDLLDLLAFGGIFSTLLFVIPIFKFLTGFIFNVKSIVNNKNNIFYLYNILLLAICFMLCAVNPLFNQPKLVIFFWHAFAYLSLKNSNINYIK